MKQPSPQTHLKRELKLPDLVLRQVLLILGISWIGYAAKQGSTHRWDFALKVGGLLTIANLLGAVLYGLGARRLARVSASPAARSF